MGSLEAMDATIGGEMGAIGYGSVGEAGKRVRALDLAVDASHPYSTPDIAEVGSLRYPMSRYLYLYLTSSRAPLPALPSPPCSRRCAAPRDRRR